MPEYLFLLQEISFLKSTRQEYCVIFCLLQAKHGKGKHLLNIRDEEMNGTVITEPGWEK